MDYLGNQPRGALLHEFQIRWNLANPQENGCGTTITDQPHDVQLRSDQKYPRITHKQTTDLFLLLSRQNELKWVNFAMGQEPLLEYRQVTISLGVNERILQAPEDILAKATEYIDRSVPGSNGQNSEEGASSILQEVPQGDSKPRIH